MQFQQVALLPRDPPEQPGRAGAQRSALRWQATELRLVQERHAARVTPVAGVAAAAAARHDARELRSARQPRVRLPPEAAPAQSARCRKRRRERLPGAAKSGWKRTVSTRPSCACRASTPTAMRLLAEEPGLLHARSSASWRAGGAKRASSRSDARSPGRDDGWRRRRKASPSSRSPSAPPGLPAGSSPAPHLQQLLHRLRAESRHAQQLLLGGAVQVDREDSRGCAGPSQASGSTSSDSMPPSIRLPLGTGVSLVVTIAVEAHQPVGLVQAVLAQQRRRRAGSLADGSGIGTERRVVDAPEAIGGIEIGGGWRGSAHRWPGRRR